jgi:hypothetical protein
MKQRHVKSRPAAPKVTRHDPREGTVRDKREDAAAKAKKSSGKRKS